MSDPELEYDPRQSYHSQMAHVPLSYSTYSAPSFRGDQARTAGQSDEASRASFSNVIPGLGLGFQHTSAQWENSQAPSGGGHFQGYSPQTNAFPPVVSENGIRNGLISGNVTELEQDDVLEEGELSEGGPEEAYEPGEVEERTANSGRDRSGSYSPYLSPREMGPHTHAPQVIHNSSLDHESSEKQSYSGSHKNLPSDSAQMNLKGKSHRRIAVEVRKEALDAILRLWPLKVRYQDYISEGIDELLLKSLFNELGFEIGMPTDDLDGALDGETTNVPIEENDASSNQAKSHEVSEAHTIQDPENDKSESRKDRIARLLALKTSKPSTASLLPSSKPARPPSSTNSATATNSASQTGAISIAQSEKSKILYQKMEALRKARELEARGQKRSHPEESSRQKKLRNTPKHVTSVNKIGSTDDHIPSVSQRQTPGPSQSPVSQSALPIPGLFLSATPQPSQPSQPLIADPAAPPKSADAVATPFKRPFGQTRESRPFLIDVSDDDDDAEMEIDSPEHNSSSLPNGAALILKPNPLRGFSTLVDNAAAARQYSSPVPTPPGIASDSSARDDLENMTKQIEAMRKRIAEAEARKKAKQSRPVSPALPPLDSQPGDTSSEAPTTSKEGIATALVSSAERRDSWSPSQTASHTPPRRLPKVSDKRRHSNEERRSRSRTTSGRLPLLEARRRERQLKLKLLQAQVASIKQEIQDTLLEEERLRENGDSISDEEQGDPESAERPALDLPMRNSTPPTEAMDTTTSSSASSDDDQHSRENTSEQEDEVSMSVSNEAEHPTERNNSEECSSIPQDTDTIMHATGTAIDHTTSGAPLTQHVRRSEMALGIAQQTTMQEPHKPADVDLDDGGSLVSDDYEPPDAEPSSSPSHAPPNSAPLSPPPVQHQQQAPPEVDESTLPEDMNVQTSAVQQSTASENTREVYVTPGMESPPRYLITRQVEPVNQTPTSNDHSTTFSPYETPLHYFRAYRFHPRFNQSVAGGLRSLTYSNKIDVKKEVCPDELTGNACPRGKQCEYQHFENMQAPDDQILLQLGACDHHDEIKKQEYINGLRQLLTDFRSRKVKDFQTISQGIIDYRAQFLGDKSKILPLGNVAI